jgi:hypothetical protein
MLQPVDIDVAVLITLTFGSVRWNAVGISEHRLKFIDQFSILRSGKEHTQAAA